MSQNFRDRKYIKPLKVFLNPFWAMEAFNVKIYLIFCPTKMPPEAEISDTIKIFFEVGTQTMSNIVDLL
jgi:hypothetical protein